MDDSVVSPTIPLSIYLHIPHFECHKTFRIKADIRLFNDPVIYVGVVDMN